MRAMRADVADRHFFTVRIPRCFDSRSRRSGGRCGLVGHFHALSFPHNLPVVKGVRQNTLRFLFCGNYCRSQHVPALPVSSRREPRLLEQDARKRVGGMVADGIAGSLTSAHSGGQEREDVFEAAHSFFDQRSFAMRLASSFVSLRRDFLPPLAPISERYSLIVFITESSEFSLRR